MPQLFRHLPPIATTPEIDTLIATDAPISFSCSGGKDSDALVLATMAELDRRGHSGPRVCVYADLGALAWESSLPHCERLAAHVGLPLVVVRRATGDLLDRWRARLLSTQRRYAALETVTLVPCWSSPALRFCTSELKTTLIQRALVARFPGSVILSAAGIRRDESRARASSPIATPDPGLRRATHRTSGMRWNPIADFSEADVLATHAAHGFARNETYARGMRRHSCTFCVMAAAADLACAAQQPETHALYRDLVALEIRSTFSFQAGRWLGDVAPWLLDADQAAALAETKDRAAARVAAEARIPQGLRFARSGTPHAVPSLAEALLLADVRRQVAAAVGFAVDYTTADAVRERIADLLARTAPQPCMHPVQ